MTLIKPQHYCTVISQLQVHKFFKVSAFDVSSFKGVSLRSGFTHQSLLVVVPQKTLVLVGLMEVKHKFLHPAEENLPFSIARL